MGNSTTQFEGGNPIFRVVNLAVSVDYYTGALGFTLDWREAGVIASVSRGRFTVFLCQGDQGNVGGWAWAGVDDVDGLWAEYRATGAKVRHPPTDYSWAYEMQVEDLDGNVLRLGAEPRPNRPTGEWLDMRGKVWVRSPAGWQLQEDG